MAKTGLYLGDTPIGRIITVSQGVGGTDATVTENDILAGKIAYGNGVQIIGNIVTKTTDDLMVDGSMVIVPMGYYAAQTEKSVANGSVAISNITISSDGMITASVTQSEGYISNGEISNTKQLTTIPATTYTPGTSDQTIPLGEYLIGEQTIKGDSNLVGENIKSGVSIFGVAGTLVVQNYYVGTDVPSNSLGNDGDLYLLTTGG